jgi:hypothetical protein
MATWGLDVNIEVSARQKIVDTSAMRSRAANRVDVCTWASADPVGNRVPQGPGTSLQSRVDLPISRVASTPAVGSASNDAAICETRNLFIGQPQQLAQHGPSSGAWAYKNQL